MATRDCLEVVVSAFLSKASPKCLSRHSRPLKKKSTVTELKQVQAEISVKLLACQDAHDNVPVVDDGPGGIENEIDESFAMESKAKKSFAIHLTN